MQIFLYFFQVDEEGGAFFGRLEGDAAVGAFDDVLRDDESEAGTIGFGGEVWGEHLGLDVKRDTGSVIGDGYLYFGLIRVVL